jgi:hypothetical protein
MVLPGCLSYSIHLFHMLARTPGEVDFGSSCIAGPAIRGLLPALAIAYGIMAQLPQAKIA